MQILDVVRGTVKAFDANNKSPVPSIIKLAGIKAEGDTALVSNFRITDNEKLGMIQCFNNTNHLYAFGHDPENSGFSVTYIAFLGKACMKTAFSSGNAVKNLVNAYNSKKISATGKTVQMTFGGGKALEGVICSMDVDVFDPEINALTVTIAGKALRWS